MAILSLALQQPKSFEIHHLSIPHMCKRNFTAIIVRKCGYTNVPPGKTVKDNILTFTSFLYKTVFLFTDVCKAFNADRMLGSHFCCFLSLKYMPAPVNFTDRSG